MDLVIGFDYQNLVKQLGNLRKAKDFLATVQTGPVEAGRIRFNYGFSPLDGKIEQVCITLEGEGPFYLLDNRTLRHISAISAKHTGFELPKVGDIIWGGNLRLKVVANHRGWPYDFIMMFPDTLSVLIYAVPTVRWIDLIYRRLILTASVWNLAKITPGEWPHWGHLKWSKEYKGDT